MIKFCELKYYFQQRYTTLYTTLYLVHHPIIGLANSIYYHLVLLLKSFISLSSCLYQPVKDGDEGLYILARLMMSTIVQTQSCYVL